MFGFDPTTTEVVAVIVATISSSASVWMAFGKTKVEANKSLVDGLTGLINELQQERDNVRAIKERERKDSDIIVGRLNARVENLEGRMSMLVIYVRKVESFLSGHRLDKQAPKFDWTEFYARRNGNVKGLG